MVRVEIDPAKLLQAEGSSPDLTEGTSAKGDPHGIADSPQWAQPELIWVRSFLADFYTLRQTLADMTERHTAGRHFTGHVCILPHYGSVCLFFIRKLGHLALHTLACPFNLPARRPCHPLLPSQEGTDKNQVDTSGSVLICVTHLTSTNKLNACCVLFSQACKCRRVLMTLTMTQGLHQIFQLGLVPVVVGSLTQSTPFSQIPPLFVAPGYRLSHADSMLWLEYPHLEGKRSALCVFLDHVLKIFNQCWHASSIHAYKALFIIYHISYHLRYAYQGHPCVQGMRHASRILRVAGLHCAFLAHVSACRRIVHAF